MKKVAIQGIAGAFHEDAARRYFQEDIEIVECRSFKKVCQMLDEDKVNYSVMAIENSIAGSLLANYGLIRDYHLRVIGEIYLHIQMNLMVYPGTKRSNIREIHSHPIALKQCAEYIDEKFHDAKLFEKSDTAAAAREVMEEKYDYVAAIGNLRSAEIYGLQVIDKGIETNKKNYTRFLILSKHGDQKPENDKASLCFELGHYHGALANVLNIFAEHKINLTKIQSIPIIGKPSEYSFHVDIEFDSIADYEKALHQVLKSVSSLAILGEYKKGDIGLHQG